MRDDAMTRESEIEYMRRREIEELHRSIEASPTGIAAAHLKLATLYGAKARSVEADLDWQPTAHTL